MKLRRIGAFALCAVLLALVFLLLSRRRKDAEKKRAEELEKRDAF
mgnify:CR=1 FL=1